MDWGTQIAKRYELACSRVRDEWRNGECKREGGVREFDGLGMEMCGLLSERRDGMWGAVMEVGWTGSREEWQGEEGFQIASMVFLAWFLELAFPAIGFLRHHLHALSKTSGSFVAGQGFAFVSSRHRRPIIPYLLLRLRGRGRRYNLRVVALGRRFGGLWMDGRRQQLSPYFQLLRIACLDKEKMALLISFVQIQR